MKLSSKHALQLILTHDQVVAFRANQVTKDAMDLAISCGVRQQWYNNLSASVYGFSYSGAAQVPDEMVLAVLAVGATVLCVGGMFVEGPTSAEDNLVPTSWPDAKTQDILDEDGIIITPGVRRRYNEYTYIITGENGTSLYRTGYRPNGSRSFMSCLPEYYKEGTLDTIDTPAILQMYMSEFDSSLFFRDNLSIWKSTNVTEEGEIV